jgi:hypothetical protein
MDFVDDDGVDAVQSFPAAGRCQHQIERLGCGHQNLRRSTNQSHSLRSGGISRSQPGADSQRRIAHRRSLGLDLGEGNLEVAMHVIGKGPQRRDVNDPDAFLQVAL